MHRIAVQSEHASLLRTMSFVKFQKGRAKRSKIMYSMWKIMCFLNHEPRKHIALHQIHKQMLLLATSYDTFKNNLKQALSHVNSYKFKPSIVMMFEKINTHKLLLSFLTSINVGYTNTHYALCSSQKPNVLEFPWKQSKRNVL